MTSIYGLRDGSPPTALPVVKFPSVPHALASTYCGGYLQELARAAASIDLAEVDRAAELLLEAHAAVATVFSCGNGGSASIANHLQCDHLKGVRTETDLTPKVLSLNSNVELLTAVANDIGYEEIFAYQLQSQSRPGDVLVAISSSGRSGNIVRALRWANEHGLGTIALTGFSGGEARKVADVAVHVDCTNYGVVEDLHQAVMHALAQYVRQSRMSADAIPRTTF
jgi:phosphoheptose isomerase